MPQATNPLHRYLANGALQEQVLEGFYRAGSESRTRRGEAAAIQQGWVASRAILDTGPPTRQGGM